MKTNPTVKTPWIAALLLLASGASLAGSVGPLTTFNAGSTAVASEVNGNFNALSTAVNDNHARIGTLETTVTGGNIVLVNSTESTGNIIKDGISFLHDFGSNNTFIGRVAGNFTMSGTNNTAVGGSALHSNTTGNVNTASGLGALYSNTEGTGNTANGVNALGNNTIGGNNTASGVDALRRNTTGNSNTASGALGLYFNTTGSQNTASGQQALYNNTTGANNTASGMLALQSNTTGSNNTAIGVGALSSNTTGGSNIAVGLNAGFGITTGISNIVIGNAGGAESNTIRIGNTDQTRAFIAGISGVTSTGGVAVYVNSAGQLGTATSSRRFKDDIADMGETSSVLKQLRPVTFHYKADQNPKGRSLQYGLVAEEVEKVAPGLVARSANGEIETVFYQHLTPMLLNEYQKQQRLIETQTALLAKQAARMAALEKQAQEIVALRQQVARMATVLSRLEKPETVASVGR